MHAGAILISIGMLLACFLPTVIAHMVEAIAGETRAYMLERAAGAVRKVLSAIFLTVLIFAGLVMATHPLSVAYDDEHYAAALFGEALSVERVVASQRWLGVFESHGCTFAAVVFSADDAAAIRRDGPHQIADQPWRATPIDAELPEDDPFRCLQALPEEDAERIQDALGQTGSWVARRADAAHFLSPESRIALLVRLGD